MSNSEKSISLDDFFAARHTPFEIIEIDIKGRLLSLINGKILESGWTQSKAAEKLGVRQPRVSDLLNLQYSKFSIDWLLRMADKVGFNVTVDKSKSLSIFVD